MGRYAPDATHLEAITAAAGTRPDRLDALLTAYRWMTACQAVASALHDVADTLALDPATRSHADTLYNAADLKAREAEDAEALFTSFAEAIR